MHPIWIDEQSALIAILEAAKNYIGVDKQKECDGIISKLLTETERQKAVEQQAGLKPREKVPENSPEKRKFVLALSGKKWNIVVAIIILGLIIAIVTVFNSSTIGGGLNPLTQHWTFMKLPAIQVFRDVYSIHQRI